MLYFGLLRRSKDKRKYRFKTGKSIGVIPIDEKMGESGLRWFVHVQRRAINASVKKCEWIQVKGMKKKMVEDL